MLRKILILLFFVFTCSFISSQDYFTKKSFVINNDSVYFYRPTNLFIENLKSSSSGSLYYLNYCINYLDEMQNALKNNRKIKNISRPIPEKSMHDMVISIQNDKKLNKKTLKLLSIINPDWFQTEFDQYIKIEKDIFYKSIKPISFLGRNDSIGFKQLCDSIVYLCDKSYYLDSIYKEPVNKFTMWSYKSKNSSLPNIDIFYYSNFEKLDYRFSGFKSSYNNIIKIWKGYFKNDNIENELKNKTFYPYKTLEINIENRKTPLNVTIFGDEKYWFIKL